MSGGGALNPKPGAGLRKRLKRTQLHLRRLHIKAACITGRANKNRRNLKLCQSPQLTQELQAVEFSLGFWHHMP